MKGPGQAGVGALLAVLLVPAVAAAQGIGAASIVGVVKDSSGAVLPGVTVEAASPVLIEKARETVTDGEGRYRIAELRPGTYSVTFTLAGFATFKRDGLELTHEFRGDDQRRAARRRLDGDRRGDRGDAARRRAQRGEGRRHQSSHPDGAADQQERRQHARRSSRAPSRRPTASTRAAPKANSPCASPCSAPGRTTCAR